jgi:alanine racemase
MIEKLKALRPTYAEIDLKALGENLNTARQLAGSDIIAVVKADSYGHGELETCEYMFHECGCAKFGVATIMEAMILREHLGSAVSIFILGHIEEKFYEEAVMHGAIVTITDSSTAASYDNFLKKHDIRADITVKLNTGMNRLGFSSTMSWYDFTSSFTNLRPVHVMSHLSSSDSDVEYTLQQCQEFEKFIKSNRIKCHTSLLNSAGIAGYENKWSLARPGIMLYGYLDGGKDVKLKKVMRIYSRVIQVQRVRKGEAVSYNRRYFAQRDMDVGVVPIGYADGYPRCLSNKSHVFVDGVKCPVVGTICMDMMMVDLTGVDINGLLNVEVLGDKIDANELASMANTISYEILTGIQSRIPRIYSV